MQPRQSLDTRMPVRPRMVVSINPPTHHQRSANRPLELIGRLEIRVVLGEHARQFDHDMTLFHGGIVLHLAIDHHGARSVTHLFDHVLGPKHLFDWWREDLFGDVDLNRVKTPRSDATHQECVPELIFGCDRVLDVAERDRSTGRIPLALQASTIRAIV